jgi:hypothetical protein
MKTKHLLYIASAIVIFFAACGGNEDKKATPTTPQIVANPDDSLEMESFDTALSREYIDTFSTLAFSNYAKRQSTRFDWSRFRMADSYSDSQLMVTNYTPDNKFYEAYGRFIKYSPDSSMFIDMDSYHVGMRKNKAGKWQGTEMEAESEVALVNLKTGKKTRVLFGGPNVSIEDALWLDKENFAIMGIENQDSLGRVAAVWKFNIPTNTFFVYELRDSLVARQLMGYWRKERLKGVLVND